MRLKLPVLAGLLAFLAGSPTAQACPGLPHELCKLADWRRPSAEPSAPWGPVLACVAVTLGVVGVSLAGTASSLRAARDRPRAASPAGAPATLSAAAIPFLTLTGLAFLLPSDTPADLNWKLFAYVAICVLATAWYGLVPRRPLQRNRVRAVVRERCDRTWPGLALRPLPSLSLRCAWCHSEALDAAACAGCGTRLHRECAEELDRCPTLGCSAAPRYPSGWCAP